MNIFHIFIVIIRRLAELPRELFVMEQERKKMQEDFDFKIGDSGRKLQEAKAASDALMAEMDKTGQAYEEMQEQNMRLIQQVRDKDKEYFALFQERIKISNLQVSYAMPFWSDIRVCYSKFKRKKKKSWRVKLRSWKHKSRAKTNSFGRLRKKKDFRRHR